jgi:hypothetical protein
MGQDIRGTLGLKDRGGVFSCFRGKKRRGRGRNRRCARKYNP